MADLLLEEDSSCLHGFLRDYLVNGEDGCLGLIVPCPMISTLQNRSNQGGALGVWWWRQWMARLDCVRLLPALGLASATSEILTNKITRRLVGMPRELRKTSLNMDTLQISAATLVLIEVTGKLWPMKHLYLNCTATSPQGANQQVVAYEAPILELDHHHCTGSELGAAGYALYEHPSTESEKESILAEVMCPQCGFGA
ncbi:hypothetical protein Ccrd_003017, partial [Cynara cardunculus var. scolymus]